VICDPFSLWKTTIYTSQNNWKKPNSMINTSSIFTTACLPRFH
jgi:hypothetical protein